jgi:hypothetical protein
MNERRGRTASSTRWSLRSAVTPLEALTPPPFLRDRLSLPPLDAECALAPVAVSAGTTTTSAQAQALDSGRSHRVQFALPQDPSLLRRVRDAIRTRHYSRRTEEAYAFWIRRFLAFHGMRHPEALEARDVASFLGSLATRQRMSASTKNQALSAILFMYRHVLGRELLGLEEIPRVKRSERVPVI